MIKQLFKVRFDKEIAIISSFVAFFILYHVFSHPAFNLIDISHLYISQATLEGIDITARLNLFFNSIFCGTLLLSFFYILFYNIVGALNVSIRDVQHLAVLSITGLLLIGAGVLGIKSNTGMSLFLIIMTLNVIIIVLKRKLNFFPNNALTVFSVSLIISVFLISAVLFLFNSAPGLQENALAIYILFSILGFFSLLGAKKLLHVSSRDLLVPLRPLIAIPFLIFISIEALFYFKVKHGILIPYKWFFVISFLIITSIHTLIRLKKNVKYPGRNSFRFYLPSALISILICTIYNPILSQPHELFELANPANAIMRIFQFREIPFADFLSSHMLSEQYYGAIYNLIFGYDGSLGFLAYKFMNEVLFMLIVYSFMKRLLKEPFLAFIFTVFFPFIFLLFSFHLTFGLLVFFILLRWIDKQRITDYLLLFVVLVTLMIWRLDTGVAALWSTLVFISVSLFTERKKIHYKDLLKSFLIIILIVAAGFMTLSVIRSPHYLLSSIKSILDYAAANQAHGFPQITNAYNQQFYLYHVFFPAFSLLAIFISIFRLRTSSADSGSDFFRFALYASIFLNLIFLMNFQRGLVRHGFIEGSDNFLSSTFFIAMGLFIISYIKDAFYCARYLAFMSISFLIVTTLKYFPIDQDKSVPERFLTQTSLQNIDKYFNDASFKGRVIPEKNFATENYCELKEFLNANLTPKETFLDFSNTPMLYYYCQRRVPSYFCQGVQNIVSDYLQLQLLKSMNTKQVPVVVYSNYPKTWFDNTDGVSNNMRQYMIAEYIFKNYKPFGIINHHSIWISKDKNYNWNIHEMDSSLTQPSIYNYKMAAGFMSRFFAKNKNKGLRLMAELQPENDSLKNGSLFRINDKALLSSDEYIKLIFDTAVEGKYVFADIMGRNNKIGSMSFITNNRDKEYMMNLSNHYLWYIDSVKYIRVQNTEDLRCRGIQIFKRVMDEN